MERRKRTLLCWLGLAAALSAVAPLAHARQSGGSTPPAPAPDYFHWSVSGPMESQVNFGRVPVKRDVVIFYEQSFGLYPRIWIDKRTGRQSPENGSVPQRTNWAGHLAKLKVDIAKAIPDPNWDGYACLDFEGWEPVWAILLNEPMKEESRRLVRAAHPTWTPQQVEAQAAVEFEAAGFDFLIRTINACKAERPKAKWGFFGYPYPHQEPYRARYQPMFDACTGFYPCIYPFHFSVPEGTHAGPGQRSIGAYSKTVTDILTLSRRIAVNRPVIAYIWMVYHDMNPQYKFQPLNDLDLNAMLRLPKQCLADGVAFWDDMQTPAQLRMYNDFFSKHQSDVMMRVLGDLFPAGAAAAQSSAAPPTEGGAPTDPGAAEPGATDPGASSQAAGAGATTGEGATTSQDQAAADEKAAKKVKTKTKAKQAKASKKSKKSGVLTKGKRVPAPKKQKQNPSDPDSDAVLRK